MEKKIKLQANEELPTKNKWKFQARDIGLSVGVYLDKMIPRDTLPEEITITLKKR